jgi:hypothetical protein
MNIQIKILPEPQLQFGQGRVGVDPKQELSRAGEGPVQVIKLGLVCLAEELSPIRQWFGRMHKPLPSREKNGNRYRPFPGMETTLRHRLEIPDRFVRIIDQDRYKEAFASANPVRRFDALLDLHARAVTSLFGDERPACVLVAFSEELAEFRISNPRLTERERRALELLKGKEETRQMDLFDPGDADEVALARELRPHADQLLFRNFYRALKARCMGPPNPVPIQVLRRHTYDDAEAQQSEGTRAWHLAVSLLYKSGEIPWQPHQLDERTCFAGISFHHLKRQSGDVVYASLAQAYSSRYEPFALKGADIPRDQLINRQPYLKKTEAQSLAERLLEEYQDQTGSKPTRVVLHKTSRFQPEEEEGFKQALLSEVPACELVWVSPTGFRLLRKGMIEPFRGTLCLAGDDSFLFTSGYVTWWHEYPGPHIPAPLQIGSSAKTDIFERATEILALTKMNWNSADGVSSLPITLSFAQKVGTMMTEMEGTNPNPLYRFYM